MTAARWWWCTAPAPGAIGVCCVRGTNEELRAAVGALTGRDVPAVGAVAWRSWEFDDGVLARVDEHTLLVMPHGGARIRAKLGEALTRAGAQESSAPDACAVYPEAADSLEAIVLQTVARATSPRAIDLLLAQPARWREALVAGSAPKALRAHDAVLARLLTPPRIMVTGAANAGKSTLMNRLAGRAVAVAHDQPGTTRDAVAVRLDLDGVVVDWFDTPGVRANADATESAAAAIATTMMSHADLVVVLSAPSLGWQALDERTRTAHTPVLRLLNKCDAAEAATCAERTDAALCISAQRGDGMAALVQCVRELLVPSALLESAEPWWFSDSLVHCANLARP